MYSQVAFPRCINVHRIASSWLSHPSCHHNFVALSPGVTTFSLEAPIDLLASFAPVPRSVS